jgi:hypothetical protein
MIFKSSIVSLFRLGSGLAGGIKPSHAPAIRAITAPVGIAGCAVFPFLQIKTAGPMARVTLSGSFAVRTFSI